MKRILLICSDNSVRSQMAEAFLKLLTFERVEALSAGIKPRSLDSRAVKVMMEIGIDISKHRTKSVNEFFHQKFDFVITLCDDAREQCPEFHGSHTKIHKSFPDPAQARGSDAEKSEVYRNVRDQIKEWLTDFVERYSLV